MVNPLVDGVDVCGSDNVAISESTDQPERVAPIRRSGRKASALQVCKTSRWSVCSRRAVCLGGDAAPLFEYALLLEQPVQRLGLPLGPGHPSRREPRRLGNFHVALCRQGGFDFVFGANPPSKVSNHWAAPPIH